MKEAKQTKGKPKFAGRVDIAAMIEPVAELRRVAVEEIGKYDETMEWPDHDAWDFLDALQRHMNKIYSAGDPYAIDPETGLPHLYAVGFNYMVVSMKMRESVIFSKKTE